MKASLLLRNQRGQAGVMAAFLLIPLIAMAGLGIDLGRMFVVRAELVKAVDGGALAGARVLPMGQETAELAANAFAEMNFPIGFMGVDARGFDVQFSQDPNEARIEVAGTALMPTTLIKIVGIDEITVNAVAEAQRRPLELSLILDTSGSLHPDFAKIDAIGYLRTASRQFVNYFDDTMDAMALTQFAYGRIVHYPLASNFRTPIRNTIATFLAAGGTTAHDAVAAGHTEVEDPVRPGAFRCMVFFTDGRPTAFRDIWTIGGNNIDGVIGGMQDPSDPVPIKLRNPFLINTALSYDRPPGWTTPMVLAESWQRTLDAGSDTRDDGITIFTIGLGNPNAGPIAQPDPGLLVALANVETAENPLNPGSPIINGYYDPTQPKGEFYFAPDATELAIVFQRVAQEITVRLTR